MVTTVPGSRATVASMPVPTERLSRGTARHGLALHVGEPISARFASSCSRKGTSEAATETICAGDVRTTLLGAVRIDSPLSRQTSRVLVDQLAPCRAGVRLRDVLRSFLDRRQVVDLVGHLAVANGGGRLMKLCLLTRA